MSGHFFLLPLMQDWARREAGRAKQLVGSLARLARRVYFAKLLSCASAALFFVYIYICIYIYVYMSLYIYISCTRIHTYT